MVYYPRRGRRHAPGRSLTGPGTGLSLRFTRPGHPADRLPPEILDAADYPLVDVAIVAESTYPYLRGGVSAVIQDIIENNPNVTFGIIHITWDSNISFTENYPVPENVRWIRPMFLSMKEHETDFMRLPTSVLDDVDREALARRLFDAFEAVEAGDPQPLWQLYDEGMNPRSRCYVLWALLGTAEFMRAAQERLAALDLPLTEPFRVTIPDSA